VLLQFINRVPSPGPAAAPPVQGAPTAALHGRSTVCPSLTMQQMQVQHDCMERWLQQAKTVTDLQGPPLAQANCKKIDVLKRRAQENRT
jgi:hypothetical protein